MTTASPRPRDEPIPGDEPLYRAIGQEHIEGEAVLPTAVDVQGTSVHRAKYCSGHIPLVASQPHLRGIAVITGGDLPPPETLHDIIYRFFVVDVPDEHPHHAEIRIRTDETSRESRRINNKAVRMVLQEALAARMRVHTRP